MARKSITAHTDPMSGATTHPAPCALVLLSDVAQFTPSPKKMRTIVPKNSRI